MKHGFWIRNGAAVAPREVVEVAVAAEEAGWDGVFVSDAMSDGLSEPMTLLAAVAARTTRITLGTWILPLPARDPVGVARAVATVDRLSGGRVLLGVGLGAPEEHTMVGTGADGATGARYDAHLEVLAALLDGETVTRDDEWFRLDGVRLSVLPVQQPRVPVLCGGWWPHRAPFRRAAAWDGTMPNWPGMGEGRDDAIEAGANERELRELLTWYREEAGGDGTVLVPRLARYGAGYDALCEELDVDWQLTCDALDIEGVRAGPPG